MRVLQGEKRYKNVKSLDKGVRKWPTITPQAVILQANTFFLPYILLAANPRYRTLLFLVT
jgi:hypothetical protein